MNQNNTIISETDVQSLAHFAWNEFTEAKAENDSIHYHTLTLSSAEYHNYSPALIVNYDDESHIVNIQDLIFDEYTTFTEVETLEQAKSEALKVLYSQLDTEIYKLKTLKNAIQSSLNSN